MAYKIRVILESKEDVFRDVLLKDNHTLWNLHNAIKSAFSLKGEDISMFNVVNEDGDVIKSIPLEDMSDYGDGETMSEVTLAEVFDQKGALGQFQYGSIELWEFMCEFTERLDDINGVNYPLTTFRFGKVPLKAPEQNTISTVKLDDFDDEFGDDEFSSDHFDNLDDYLDGSI